jgi:glycosyltransferase involved in cell wall biosynthesis
VSRSLSVLLPVKNAQSTLASTVHKILDVISEISEQVEILIIDDGSADATSEVAIELTRHYPQIRAICQNRSIGREAAIRMALQKCTGDVALIHEEEQGSPLGEIIKALKSCAPKGLFFFRLDTPKDIGRKKLLPHYYSPTSFDSADKRQAPISSRPAKPNYLERIKGIVLGE